MGVLLRVQVSSEPVRLTESGFSRFVFIILLKERLIVLSATCSPADRWACPWRSQCACAVCCVYCGTSRCSASERPPASTKRNRILLVFTVLPHFLTNLNCLFPTRSLETLTKVRFTIIIIKHVIRLFKKR